MRNMSAKLQKNIVERNKWSKQPFVSSEYKLSLLDAKCGHVFKKYGDIVTDTTRRKYTIKLVAKPKQVFEHGAVGVITRSGKVMRIFPILQSPEQYFEENILSGHDADSSSTHHAMCYRTIESDLISTTNVWEIHVWKLDLEEASICILGETKLVKVNVLQPFTEACTDVFKRITKGSLPFFDPQFTPPVHLSISETPAPVPAAPKSTTCPFVLVRGKRKGCPCGKRTLRNKMYCKAHESKEPIPEPEPVTEPIPEPVTEEPTQEPDVEPTEELYNVKEIAIIPKLEKPRRHPVWNQRKFFIDQLSGCEDKFIYDSCPGFVLVGDMRIIGKYSADKKYVVRLPDSFAYKNNIPVITYNKRYFTYLSDYNLFLLKDSDFIFQRFVCAIGKYDNHGCIRPFDCREDVGFARLCNIPLSNIGLDIWLKNTKPPATIPPEHPLGYDCCSGIDTAPICKPQRVIGPQVKRMERQIAQRGPDGVSKFMLAEYNLLREQVVEEDERFDMVNEDKIIPDVITVRERIDMNDISDILNAIQI